MKKIFELPIYGLRPKILSMRVQNKTNELKEEYKDLSDEKMTQVIEHETFPMRVWEYNHIIGYIKISVTTQDVWFNIYLPYYSRERYIWDTKKKNFLLDIHANGTHFYVCEEETNDSIRNKVDEILRSIIDKYIPERYYVDTSIFENINFCIDYKTIMKNSIE